MKKISFIGGYDKTDLVMYLAKILVECGNSVLLVDATILERARYIIPTMKQEDSYVTNFEGIDMAIGFDSFEEIRAGLGMPISAPLNYDYIFLDTDYAEAITNFGVEQFDKHYFVTSFDLYSIRKGIETLSPLVGNIKCTKVLFTNRMNKKDNEYIDYLTMGSKIEWEPEVVYFPFEVGDKTAIFENQRASKIRLGGLSNQAKEQLTYLAYQLLQLNGQDDYNMLKKVVKKIERGV